MRCLHPDRKFRLQAFLTCQAMETTINFESIRQFEIHALDTSSSEAKYVICYKKRHFEVGQSVARLIGILQQSDTLDQARERFSAERGRELTQEQMDQIVSQCIIPILSSENIPQPKPFLVKIELVPARIVAVASRALRYLFAPRLAVPLLGLIVILNTLFYTHGGISVGLSQLDLLTILGVAALYILSSCFHELGHAAACQHYGISHGGVGFGLYLNFPVFYTDVSDIWRLPRRQRLVVNMAGTYFQLIFLLPVLALYLATGNPILKYFVITVNANFLITLNPFFKFDGYWIVSDLLGVPNLRRRTNEMLGYLWKRLRRKPIRQRPFLFTMPTGAKAFMISYTVVVNCFFGYFFCYALPRFVYNFFSTFPGHAKELISQIALGNIPSFSLVKYVFMQLLFFGFLVFALYRIVRPLVARYLRKSRISSAAQS